MRIFIDIGHPAHVHYFRNCISIMQAKGHEFFLTAREKDVSLQLLQYYKLPYVSRGRGKTDVVGKVLHIPQADKTLFRFAKQVNPDLFLSFGSPYSAHVSILLGKPHIAFDDTEHAVIEHLMYVPFTKAILTPHLFKKSYGKKHIRFDGIMDLCYLSPNYFAPDIAVLKELNTRAKEYVFLRFVSWKASHDMNQSGLSIDDKRYLVNRLSKNFRVFISSEDELPREFQPFKISLHPSKIHDVLFNAAAYFGESTTMATESAVLGIPSFCFNSATKYFGVFDDLRKYGLLVDYFISDGQNSIKERLGTYIEKVESDHFRQSLVRKRKKYLEEKIDVTQFMIWFVENYPASFSKIKSDPGYQYHFKNQV